MITSPAEYIQRLAEIQQLRYIEVQMINPSNEPVFTINADTRVITVPTKFRQAAVYTDHNSETLYFEIDRYFDAADLKDKTCIVQYINALGEERVYAVTTRTFTNDKVTFAWKLSNNVTKEPGKVTFSVRFYELDLETNEFLYSFNTKTAQFEIAKSLNLPNSPEVYPNGDDLSELVEKINRIYQNENLSAVDYETLVFNRPKINGTELIGDISGSTIGIPTVDQGLDSESTNPIANAAVSQALDSIDVTLSDMQEEIKRIDEEAVVADDTLDESSTNPIQNAPVATKFTEIDEAIVELQNKKVDMDVELNVESENPVTNKAITTAINELWAEIADLTYVPIAITKFENDVNNVEIGSTVETINFTWAVTKTPLTLMINEEPLPEVSATSYTLTDQSIVEDTIFTLKATDKSGEVSAETSINFMNGLYYGVAVMASEFDSAFVLSLDKELKENLSVSFAVNAEADQYIYFAAPASYGEATFTVGGFDGGFTKVSTIDFTNASNYTESYNIYRSDNMNLGNTTVKIS